MAAHTHRRLGTEDTARLFPVCVADAVWGQRQQLRDCARHLRAVMGVAMEQLDITSSSPDISGIWSARTRLMGASIAVADLLPERLSGYGGLTEAEIRTVRALAAELSRRLKQMERCLAQGQ